MKKKISFITFLFLALMLTTSTVFSQKIFIYPDGYVSLIEYTDNILAPNEYTGTYQYSQPVEDENGNYLDLDGYAQKLDLLINGDNQKLTESLEVEGWDKPQVTNIDKFKIDENKLSTDSYSGYFRTLKYKNKKGKTIIVECLLITQDGFEKIFVKNK